MGASCCDRLPSGLRGKHRMAENGSTIGCAWSVRPGRVLMGTCWAAAGQMGGGRHMLNARATCLGVAMVQWTHNLSGLAKHALAARTAPGESVRRAVLLRVTSSGQGSLPSQFIGAAMNGPIAQALTSAKHGQLLTHGTKLKCKIPSLVKAELTDRLSL